jgi:hypothetical protein
MPATLADQLVIARQKIEEERRKWEEEYQKNVEALERVARFLPSDSAIPTANAAQTQPDAPRPTANQAQQEDEESATLIDAVLEAIVSRPTMSLSPRMVFNVLVAQNFPFAGDENRSLVSIGASLRKLAARQHSQIRLFKRGSGRRPNLYRIAKAERTEEPSVTERVASSEMTM